MARRNRTVDVLNTYHELYTKGVFDCMNKGEIFEVIAKKLDISSGTVERHLRRYWKHDPKAPVKDFFTRVERSTSTLEWEFGALLALVVFILLFTIIYA